MRGGTKEGWAMQSGEVWLRGKLGKSLQCGEVSKTHCSDLTKTVGNDILRRHHAITLYRIDMLRLSVQ